MEDLTKYTATELLKMINDINISHNLLKEELINHTFELDEIEKKINSKITILNEIEKNYIDLIEEINNR